MAGSLVQTDLNNSRVVIDNTLQQQNIDEDTEAQTSTTQSASRRLSLTASMTSSVLIALRRSAWAALRVLRYKNNLLYVRPLITNLVTCKQTLPCTVILHPNHIVTLLLLFAVIYFFNEESQLF